LIAGERVPDRFSEPAGEIDLGDLPAALAADAVFELLVALCVDGVAAGDRGGVDQRPAQIARPVL
jgi:hypothetical protein